MVSLNEKGKTLENNFKKQVVPFTQVPNNLLYNPDISFKAKGLWAYMSAKPDGWNFSANRIAEETKEERKAILAGLKELSENGYITAKKKSDGRIEYILHWETIKTSSPETEPKSEAKTLSVSEIKKPTSRPKKTDYETEEEYEKAFYDWNSRVIM